MTAAAAWDAKLASEGLAPVDDGSGQNWVRGGPGRRIEFEDPNLSSGQVNRATAQLWTSALNPEAIDAWLSWASDVLHTHAFAKGQRKVWELYAEGKTYSEIETATRTGRRDISRIVADVEAKSPAPPCPNPWRKSGRAAPRAEGLIDVAARTDPRITARLLSLAVSVADSEALARLMASDEQLNNLTGGASVAEAVKRAVGEVRYARILLKRGETLRGPKNNKDLSVLLASEFGGELVGRPHAGGIDLQAKVTTGDVVVNKVLTVPWWKIDHAEKVSEDA